MGTFIKIIPVPHLNYTNKKFLFTKKKLLKNLFKAKRSLKTYVMKNEGISPLQIIKLKERTQN